MGGAIRFFRRAGHIIPIRLAEGFTPHPIYAASGILQKAKIVAFSPKQSPIHAIRYHAKVFDKVVAQLNYTKRAAGEFAIENVHTSGNFRELGLASKMFNRALRATGKVGGHTMRGDVLIHPGAVSIRDKYDTIFKSLSHGFSERISSTRAKVLSTLDEAQVSAITKNPFFRKKS